MAPAFVQWMWFARRNARHRTHEGFVLRQGVVKIDAELADDQVWHGQPGAVQFAGHAANLPPGLLVRERRPGPDLRDHGLLVDEVAQHGRAADQHGERRDQPPVLQPQARDAAGEKTDQQQGAGPDVARPQQVPQPRLALVPDAQAHQDDVSAEGHQGKNVPTHPAETQRRRPGTVRAEPTHRATAQRQEEAQAVAPIRADIFGSWVGPGVGSTQRAQGFPAQAGRVAERLDHVAGERQVGRRGVAAVPGEKEHEAAVERRQPQGHGTDPA